jgi:hypothetical protein
MADYRKEFPDFPAIDMPAIPEGFADSSWHNDSCPSLISEALGLRIWIDYVQVELREHADDGYPRLIGRPPRVHAPDAEDQRDDIDQPEPDVCAHGVLLTSLPPAFASPRRSSRPR